MLSLISTHETQRRRPMETPKWPFITFQVFGATNFLVAILGMLFLVLSVISMALAEGFGNAPNNPYFVPSFCAMIAMNICFLGLLMVGGFYLFQRRMLGVAVCNVVFVAEILYFFAVGLLWGSLPRAISMSVAAATGVGNAGLGPQLVSGYPLIALITRTYRAFRPRSLPRLGSSLTYPRSQPKIAADGGLRRAHRQNHLPLPHR